MKVMLNSVDTICAIEDGALNENANAFSGCSKTFSFRHFDETFYMKKFPGVNGRNG